MTKKRWKEIVRESRRDGRPSPKMLAECVELLETHARLADHDLLHIRGWIGCWIPLGLEDREDLELKINGVRLGNLTSAVHALDDLRKALKKGIQ